MRAHVRSPRRGLAQRVALASTLVMILAACVTAGPAPAPEPTTPPPVAATWPPPPAPSPTPAPATPTGPPTVTIGLVGDLMFARDVVTLMEQHGPGYAFERVTPLFAGVDLLVGNLEGTFSDRGERLDKYYTFRAPPRLAVALRDAGFDAVSLANNHALDYGPVSLADTRATLDAIGVGYFGAGAGTDEAMRPLVLEAPAGRVALLGFSAVASSVFASKSGPGVARATAEVVATEVGAAAADVDYVVVVFHFGREYDAVPTSEQRALAHAAADAGAVLVVGHHAHVLQPWERRGDALILYGLGNFVFDLDREDLATLGEGPFATVVAVVELSEHAPPRLAFLPAYIDPDENRPRPATDAEAARMKDALRQLSTE